MSDDMFYARVCQERDALRAELARLQRNEDCVQRLIVWASENGWNGVDNSKILDSFIVGLFDELRAELAAAKNRALIAEKQDERSRHLVCLWKDDREAQSKALSAMTAERDQLAADNERLREALKALREEVSAGCAQDAPVEELKPGIYFEVVLEVDEALAATPAQSLAAHDAAVKVAVLREVAETCKFRLNGGEWRICPETLLAEADRIEKEAANGEA